MAPKHRFYHQSIFWIQVTILLGITELVSSCHSVAPSTTAVRIISTHQATPRQRRAAEKNAIRAYRAFGQLERDPVIKETYRLGTYLKDMTLALLLLSPY
jgi:hypothetical protein